jgi:abhydrolase domain-containing protein 6
MKILNILLIISTLILYGCSKYDRYDWFIESTRNSANLELQDLRINDGKLVYLENKNKNYKSNEIIILIHGFGANKDSWLYLAKELSKDYHLIIPDLPGHGNSFKTDSKKYTIGNQATWLNDFIAKKKIKNFTLIGNSMGGAISLRYSNLYPEKLNNLILITSFSSSCIGVESEYSRLLSKGVNPLITNNLEDYEKLLDFVMYERRYIPSPILEVLAEKKTERKLLDEKIFSDFISNMFQKEDILNNITTNTLILWGEYDRVIDLKCANILEENIRNSKKLVLKNVGHVPQVEVPEKLSNIISNFL